MTKAVNKQVSKSQTIQLLTDAPWSTLSTHILSKISTTLKLAVIDISDYEIMCHIARVLPKPGMVLTSDADYANLLQRIAKVTADDPTVNVTIYQAQVEQEEKSSPEDGLAKKSKKKGQRRDPATLPGNVNKNNFIQSLCDHWKCPKQQPSCMGMHCFVDPDGIHLPLSHERFDCWASAMVSPISSRFKLPIQVFLYS